LASAFAPAAALGAASFEASAAGSRPANPAAANAVTSAGNQRLEFLAMRFIVNPFCERLVAGAANCGREQLYGPDSERPAILERPSTQFNPPDAI
jgi:hypothetical protein